MKFYKALFASIIAALPFLTALAQMKSAAELVADAERVRNDEQARFKDACAAAGQDVRAMSVGLASSMASVRPRTDIIPALPLREVSISLARNEKESVQIVVMPGESGLKNVCVSVSDLETEGWFFGLMTDTFSADNIDCAVVGYVNATNMPPYYAGFWNEEGKRKRGQIAPGWWPDPILGFMDSADVAVGDVQSFWIRVRCPKGQKAGTYHSTLLVTADGTRTYSVPFHVRVYDFSIPDRAPLPLAITFSPGEKSEPGRLWRDHMDEWGDFLADYYITMDSLYHHGDIKWDVLARLKREDRLGCFNLGYWGPLAQGADAEAKWRETTLGRIKKAYAKAKELDLLDHAYIYGCDEAPTNTFADVARAAAILKDEFPDVPVSTTAFDNEYGTGTALARIDSFTPLTRYYDREKARTSREAGHEVWWYICCIPSSPYANMFIECPPIEGRILMGAASIRERPDGFLYYQISSWGTNDCITSGPFTKWDPCTWKNFNGDGSWTCAGPGGTPLATIRLENFRDGLEDYAYAAKLEKLVNRKRHRSRHRHGRKRWVRWKKKALEQLAVPQDVMQSMTEFTGDPNVLLRWRDAMAELIESAP